jgi:AraC-like DNA-binding protein
MHPWHQKNLLGSDAPFALIITDDNAFPPHWHEATEVVYALDADLRIGVNQDVYALQARDIAIIGGGEVHYFLHHVRKIRRAVIVFNPLTFDPFTAGLKDKSFGRVLIRAAGEDTGLHLSLETQIRSIIEEYEEKREGYPIALKARLCDFIVTLLRGVPMEARSPRVRIRQLNRLERLDQVFDYVEAHHIRPIPLREIAAVAHFSEYYFTRFFREATGMTFGQYLNNFRTAKAAEYLRSTSDSITDIAFKAGFGSVKNFNRVFRQIKGCSPSTYKWAISE